MTDSSPSIAACLDAVAQETNTTYRALISAHRGRYIARPRQIAYWLAFRYAGRTYAEIGRQIGNRDHTTVLKGVRQVEKLRAAGDERTVRWCAASLHRLFADPRQTEIPV